MFEKNKVKLRTIAQRIEPGFNLTGFSKIVHNQPYPIPGYKKVMVDVLSILLTF